MKVVEFQKEPRLCLFAMKDIPPGVEIRYNYQAINLWWRKKVILNRLYFAVLSLQYHWSYTQIYTSINNRF